MMIRIQPHKIPTHLRDEVNRMQEQERGLTHEQLEAIKEKMAVLICNPDKFSPEEFNQFFSG